MSDEFHTPASSFDEFYTPREPYLFNRIPVDHDSAIQFACDIIAENFEETNNDNLTTRQTLLRVLLSDTAVIRAVQAELAKHNLSASLRIDTPEAINDIAAEICQSEPVGEAIVGAMFDWNNMDLLNRVRRKVYAFFHLPYQAATQDMFHTDVDTLVEPASSDGKIVSDVHVQSVPDLVNYMSDPYHPNSMLEYDKRKYPKRIPPPPPLASSGSQSYRDARSDGAGPADDGTPEPTENDIQFLMRNYSVRALQEAIKRKDNQ